MHIAQLVTYDFDDGSNANLSSGYGSMQIHNHGAGETILAYNRWGSNSTTPQDLGIGNNTATTNPDWTFRQNSSSDYTLRDLYVLVEPGELGLSLTNPTGRVMYQRSELNLASVAVEGMFGSPLTRIEARAVPHDGFGGVDSGWQVIDTAPRGGAFTGELTLAGGWYDVEVRGYDGSTLVGEDSISGIGVGEIFITAGQSNSANSGETRTSPTDERVSAFSPNQHAWVLADDPQPFATASGGSPWPTLGDILVDEYGVPIGFYSVGVGGTPVSRWRPVNHDLYPRLEQAITDLDDYGGFRAILWHQGKNDAGAGTSAEDYATWLQEVIDQSRLDAGTDVPWGVAIASYRPGTGVDPDIQAGQWGVISGDPLVFLGADNDNDRDSPQLLRNQQIELENGTALGLGWR